MGMVDVAAFAARDGRSRREDDRYLALNKLGRQRRQTIELIVCRTVKRGQVAALDVAALLKSRTKWLDCPIGQFT